ncbi:FACT complex subunit SSRP1-like [Pomacea canaliculata]|uniref:FACT complex subunit SSRP1-like n=1 Tax=Pomacea canaliculata TaxID=400727 RepID=UPI000D73B338|nr:FACT complex subunit SSRP1-like [Pomacea canaliculata]
MSDFQEYPDVLQEVRGALNPGRLKLQRNSVIFKNNKTGKVDQFQSSDVDKAQWLKRARGNCLKLVLNNGGVHRYDGFKETDYDRLNKFLSDFYELELEKVDMSLKGWNWGLVKFEGNALNFEVDQHVAFEVPLTNVSHSTTSKNEVTLEFHQNDDAAVHLTELRFHVPSDPSNPDNDPVQEFYRKVMNNADIIQAVGDAICTLSEVQCLTPRGRYDIKLYPTFLQLHGKTFDYKIPYTTILRLFLLPHKDGRQTFFVVSLDPPIKQGQTRYHFLILLFNKEDEMTIEMGLSEEDLAKKYDDKLQKEMSGPEYELVSRVFKVITGRKITVPGSFTGHSGTQAIGCSYKAATGLLYPLERGFIFVHKPPIHIRFDEVSSVNFGRSAGNTRSFDFDVETKSGNVYNFVGIEKDEYGKLYDFVSNKKLRVKNIGGSIDKQAVAYEEMSGSDEEAGDHDAYLEHMKAEGKQRDEEDDDDDSSDESFNPGDSGSEVAEEYDSNPPTTSSDDSDSDYSGESGSGEVDSEAEDRRAEREERERKKKEKKEKEKKNKSAKTVPEGPQKRRTKKGGKDPNMPKRPQSAYFIWLNENRDRIKKENPGISITEVSKIAGELWKELSDKSEWEQKAKKAKAEYEEAMAEYRQNAGGDPSTAKSKSPKKAPARKSDGGSGVGDFKSKEFISSEESSSDSDKPLKKKTKKEAEEEKAASSALSSEEEEEEASEGGSDAD